MAVVVTTAAADVIAVYAAKGLTLVTAESCTGGLVAAALTGVSGASAVVERGWVVYSNAAKQQELGVSAALLEQFGAVSEPVALAMAEGALAHGGGDVAVSITGIAGPTGGTAEKPVGLVHFACQRKGFPPKAVHHVFAGDRDQVRAQATLTALALLGEAALL